MWSFPFLQCSSWRPGSWSTPLVWTPLWSGPSAGNLTSTTPASVRSAGVTCWPSSGSCSPCSCPFLPNTRRRSSYPRPPYLRSYSAPTGCAAPVVTALSDLGGETPAGFRGDAVGEGPNSTTHCLPASFMWWFNVNWNVWCFNITPWLRCSSVTCVFFMLTPEMISQKIQGPHVKLKQCVLNMWPSKTDGQDGSSRASPTSWKTLGWISVTVLGPSCYKLENAEASKDIFRQRKSKRQFKFRGGGQHNTVKEKNYEQVPEQKD